jgi:gliding motility-associated-like protein
VRTAILSYQIGILLSLLCAIPAKAQIRGGLGHAVLYEHFGLGNSDPSTIGPALPPGRTGYSYSNNWCPPTGSYTLARSTNFNGCAGQDWLHIISDRTSDYNPAMDNGFMMIVNNPQIAQDVYVDTVNADFCAGITYNYSIALINLHKDMGCTPAFPDFTFTIESVTGNIVYLSFNSGPLSYEDPTRINFNVYGSDFVLPAGVNQVVARVRAYPGGSILNQCGADFAIDDIIIQAVGPNVNINYTGIPQLDFVMSACYQDNKTVLFEGRADPYYSNPAYQWEKSTDGGQHWSDIPGATSVTYQETFNIPDTFFYRLRLAEAANINFSNCGVVSNTLRVEINGIPAVYDVTSNSPVCAGQNLQFNAEGGARYTWWGPNGFSDNIQQPHIFFSSLQDSGWYYAEIISLGGCRVTDSTYVVVNGTNVTAGPDTAICLGDVVRLNSNTGAVSYQWTPATGLSSSRVQNPEARATATTLYTVTVTDSDGCTDTAQLTLRVRNTIAVKAEIGGSDWICRNNDSAFFSGKSQGVIAAWEWDFGNGQFASLEQPAAVQYAIPSSRSSYLIKLRVTDTAGCENESSHILRVADNCYIAVPTGFTPDNNGLNDYLYPLNAYKAGNLVFRVYNRLGQLVFEGRDYTAKWDGRVKGIEQPAGTYVWILEYTDVKGKRILQKGTTVLIR